MAVAEFFFAIEQELDEGSVDVAEAEEAEVVGVNWQSLAQGLKPRFILDDNAALKRRSSTVFHASAKRPFQSGSGSAQNRWHA